MDGIERHNRRVMEEERVERAQRSGCYNRVMNAEEQGAPKPIWRWFRHHCPLCAARLRAQYHTFYMGVDSGSESFITYDCSGPDCDYTFAKKSWW